MPFSSSSSSSTNIESKYTTKQLVKSNKSFQTTDSNLDIGKMLKGSLNNVKDEIEDIFDAVIFAENTEERVEATKKASRVDADWHESRARQVDAHRRRG